ncbi:MAG: aldo/keto reductase [Alistipes sp.]|nr:aldo/keto reductase [Alistipes sp.]
MKFVTLINGVKMPILGFGTWPLKGNDLKIAFKYSYEEGCRLYDTANRYANEWDLGDAIREFNVNKDELFITSKIDAIRFNGNKRFLYLNAKSVKRAYKESCKRLGTDRIDLYLLHSPFKNYIKAYGQLLELYNRGLVRAIGVCNCDVVHLELIKQTYGVYPMINQIELHLLNQQKRVVQYCQEHNIQVQAFSPFTKGEMFKELFNNDKLLSIAKTHNKSVAQIIIRWIIQRDIVVIPSSSSKAHIEDNYNVFDFELSDVEMRNLSEMDRKQSYCDYVQVIV